MAKARPMVIVESPTKVKTINKILGNKYKVVSSMGHLVDLPKSTLGVDIENNFEPRLIVVRNKQKMMTKLKKEAKNRDAIYMATDPDREGEAIGWNLAQHLGDDKKYYRVTFQEITKPAVLKAFENPREFDRKKIDAQLARRILDRIVGYKISPVLWKKVGSRLSAGRVQSVALRLIVDREREIRQFKPEEYWKIAVDLQKEGFKDILTANLEKIKGEKFALNNEAAVRDVAGQLKNQEYTISDVSEKEVRRNPQAPYITSTLQQDAFNKLNFNSNKTMQIAQQLYEGIEVGEGEPVGLITYMRTDSVNISKEALGVLQSFIKKEYGLKYLPEAPNTYKSKKSAQEAHEAIRPTDVMQKPAAIEKYLTADQFKLYQLIWRRFVSSQMTPAVYLSKKIVIEAGDFQLGASGSTLIFDGHLTLHIEDKEEELKLDLTHFQKGDQLDLLEVKPTQHFTKPPPRYSEASLVKALEEDGIGRPSTYAAIIQTLVYRNYVLREKGYFSATELGMKICDLLVEYFTHIMDIGFTAQMEESLDLVEEGKLEYPSLLAGFYGPFEKELEYAMKNIEKTEKHIGKDCPECGAPLVVKWGRKGKFVSCSAFPKCKYAEPFKVGVKCPQEGCDGDLVKRKSRGGRSFYGCTNYPKCTFTTNKLPEKEEASDKEQKEE